MNIRVSQILAMIRKLEEELEVELARGRVEFCYKIDNGKVEFEQQILKYHKRIRRHWLPYVLDARPAVLLTAPIIYALILPFALLDLSVSVYQFICFRVYGVASVCRSDHLAFDRGQLAYLNWFERFNCRFCSYANGVVSYVREVAARTEQYWCPIKHARAYPRGARALPCLRGLRGRRRVRSGTHQAAPTAAG
jgi:hypothetical protein